MKKKLHLWLGMVCLALPLTVFSQTNFNCGFDSILLRDPDAAYLINMHWQGVNEYRQRNPVLQFLPNGGLPGGQQQSGGLTCRKARYILPVVVHVIYDPADSVVGMGSNISDAQIEDQLEALNYYLSNANNAPSPAVNTGIQVCLASRAPNGNPFSGITRRADALTTHRAVFPDVANLMALDRFPVDRYLNIWIVKTILDSAYTNSGIMGYSILPVSFNNNDGIVLRYRVTGDHNTCTGCNLDSDAEGKVAVHELGHYLGLLHPFTMGCTWVDSMPCNQQGDMCCDVPPVYGQNFNNCSSTRNTCTNDVPDLPDQVQNYMDYTGEFCASTFTHDQVQIMYAVLEGQRSILISAANLNTAHLQCCKFNARFETDKTALCSPDSVFCTAIDSIDGAAYHWYLYKGQTLVQSNLTSGSTFHIFLSDTLTHMVKLTVVVGGDSISYQLSDSIAVINCGTALASEQGNWYFGNACGLKFNNGNVTTIDIEPSRRKPFAINTHEACISQSNRWGQLLFYGGASSNTVGSIFFLYNQKHDTLQNSDSLYMDASSTQGALAIPLPGDTTRYYLLLDDETAPHNGLRWSLVDMTGDSGRGVVTVKNQRILPPPGNQSEVSAFDGAVRMGEAMTAIPQCNERDYWLLFQDKPVGSTGGGNILVYAVRDSGIFYNSTYNPGTTSPSGQLKAAPDGKFLYGWGKVFSFDRVNGIVSGQLFDTYNKEAYGGSFSPDSRLLYIQHNYVGVAGDRPVYQYDLYSSDPVASRKLVGTLTNVNGGQMQMGPDGRIYIAVVGRTQLPMILRPNVRDTVPGASGFTEKGPLLFANNIGGVSRLGLPNMIDAKKPSEVPKDFQQKISNCRTVKFSPSTLCVSSIKWLFGDGDTSAVPEPSHTYAQNGTYTVKMIVGTDTVTKIVSIGMPNAPLSGDTLYCDSKASYYYSTIFRYNYQYQWLLTNGSFSSPSGQSEVAVKWHGVGAVQVIVSNPDNGCRDTASLNVGVIPFFNSIDSVADTICPGTALYVAGSAPCSPYFAVEFQWQYKDTGSFVDLPYFYTTATDQNLDEPNWSNQCQLRRRSVASGDTTYSNVAAVQYTPFDNSILALNGQPYYAAICSGSTPPQLRGTSPCNEGLWSFLWQSTSDTSGAWTNIPGSYYLNYSPWINTTTMFYRRRAFNIYLYDTSYSPAYEVYIRNPAITTQPVSATVNEGNTVTFTCQSRDLQPLKWQEGVLKNGDTIWTDRTGFSLGYNFSLGFTADQCLSGHFFRAVYWNECSTDTVRSSTVLLTVNYTDWDLWALDNSNDNGSEPSSGFIWNSPDIWNRKEDDNATGHENPEYRVSAPNYIHAIVRNRGTATSIPAKLYLYWTFASTGERWDRSWRNNLSDSSPVTGNWRMYYGNRRAMGDLIGVFSIPAIGASGSYRLDTIWYAPDPGIVYGDSNATEAEVCFLSRIVTCAGPPYGMANAEKTDLGYNVRYNNNSITRNFIVTDNLPGNQRIHWVGNGNTVEDEAATGKLVFKTSNYDYYNYGTVLLHLDSTLRSIWFGTGSGFIVLDDSTLQVTPGRDAELTNIAYDIDQQAMLGVEFSMLAGIEIGESNIIDFGFELTQYINFDETDPVGGVSFMHTMHLGPISQTGKSARTQPKQQYGTTTGSAGNNTAGIGDKTGTQTGKQNSANVPARKQKQGVLNWNVRPNPFSDEMQIVYWLPEQSNVQLGLYDVYGHLLKAVTPTNNLEGNHSEVFETGDLKMGVYYATITVNGMQVTKKVVLVR